MNEIIRVKNLNFSYSEQPLLQSLCLEVRKGEFVSIAGPNGAGKTTLLNLLSGSLKVQSGTIEVDSQPIQNYSVRSLAQKIAVVRQEFVPIFDFTAAEIVSMARIPYSDTFGFESKSDKKIIKEAMEITETLQFASRALRNLSSGERQRVFIARAMAQDTPILLLDEPTSFLDIKHQVNIYDLLKSAQQEKGKTIIAITHDINLAAQYSDTVLLMSAEGNYQYGRTIEILVPPEIERVFGIRTFVGRVGEENFFLPLGKFAKDSGQVKKRPDN